MLKSIIFNNKIKKLIYFGKKTIIDFYLFN